jgi:two-component system sensor histidine kinase DegS
VSLLESPDEGDSKRGGALDVIGIIRAQEEERERLARAMHDGPAQSLTNFILQAEICQRLFDRDPDRAAEELNNLKTNASKTFQKVRDFIFDLRPMMLGDLGVLPTIRRYVESYREKTDIDVVLDISGEERRLEQYREVMIFRGVQDVMGMARDYASPGEIQLDVVLNPDMIQVTIEDDGRGFDSEDMFERAEEEGHTDARVQALNMLKNQFELVGGDVSVRSDESDGTIVRLELPVR